MKHARVQFAYTFQIGCQPVGMTWSTPFADANYTVGATVESADQLTISATSRTTTGVSFLLCNNNPFALSENGFIHVIAIHD
jgi:hypothetical protein